MAKPKTLYSCTECGGQLPKWQGQYPHCHAWNTLGETVAEPATASKNRFSALEGVAAKRGVVQSLSKVREEDVPRKPTGNSEFDCVLGGGLVEGGVVLIGISFGNGSDVVQSLFGNERVTYS